MTNSRQQDTNILSTHIQRRLFSTWKLLLKSGHRHLFCGPLGLLGSGIFHYKSSLSHYENLRDGHTKCRNCLFQKVDESRQQLMDLFLYGQIRISVASAVSMMVMEALCLSRQGLQHTQRPQLQHLRIVDCVNVLELYTYICCS